MAENHDPVKAEDLRSIREELVGRITDQQRALNVEPSVRRAEEFLDEKQVMQRIEREHERERFKPKAKPGKRSRRWQARQGDGAPSPLEQFQPGRVRGPNLRGQNAVFRPVTKGDIRQKLHLNDNPITQAVRARIRFLGTHPEFKDRIQKLVFDHAVETNGKLELDNAGKDKLLALWLEADKKLGAIDVRQPLKLFSIPGASPKGNFLSAEKIRAELMRPAPRTLGNKKKR